jgi:hypothetical protein
MFEVLMARGDHIAGAISRGAARNYNRSRQPIKAYERILQEAFEYQLSRTPEPERVQIRDKYQNRWQIAYLPVHFIMIHEHIGGVPSEPHARLAIYTSKNIEMFDVTLEDFNEFLSLTEAAFS